MVILLLLIQSEAITPEKLREHLTVLASDEFEGRNAGYEGNVKAGDYIAEHLKAWGYAPEFQAFQYDGRDTRNVLALIEGGDDLVVIGAHYDHVGLFGQAHMGRGRKTDDDEIYNGADDNGSGTTALLGVAEALAGHKPKRSILLIWFSAEEGGLVGSKHYLDNPIRPLEKHVAMINMDMVGRNPERPVDIAGVASERNGHLRAAIEAAVAATKLDAAVVGFGDVKSPVSDHHPFFSAEIPALSFFTGFHPDYHNVTDHADKIDYERMAAIARTAERTVRALADADGTFAFRAPRPLEFRRRRVDEDERKALGIEGGAVKVRTLEKGSACERAGIRRGDIVAAVGGRALPVEDAHKVLYDWLESAPAGVAHGVVLYRDGERLTVTVQWEE